MRLFALARPAEARDRSALPIAGDDVAAKAQAVELLDVLGYDAVDIGPLAESWRSEPGTPVYVTPYDPTDRSGLSPEEAGQAFFAAPGVAVPADRVKALVDEAVSG